MAVSVLASLLHVLERNTSSHAPVARGLVNTVCDVGEDGEKRGQ